MSGDAIVVSVGDAGGQAPEGVAGDPELLQLHLHHGVVGEAGAPGIGVAEIEGLAVASGEDDDF